MVYVTNAFLFNSSYCLGSAVVGHFMLRQKEKKISKLGYFFFQNYHNGFAIFHDIFILVSFEDIGFDNR